MKTCKLNIAIFKEIYLLIVFLFFIYPTLSLAQLTKYIHPNLISESDLYFDSNGNKYSDLITFKFKQRIIDLPQNQKIAQINNISNLSLRNFFNSLQSKYGSITLEKVFTTAYWGDTLKLNWRTRQIVPVPDLSQVFRVKFNRLVNIDSIMNALMQFPQIEYAHEPIQAFLVVEPNDSLYVYGNKWAHLKISAPFAWDLTKGNFSIKLAIHDLYNDEPFPHPDLAPKIVYHEGKFGGHGQAVAGVAGAATNNLIGIASLGWNLPVGLFMWYLDRIYTAVDSGFHVINFSWITFSDYYHLRQAIQYALARGVVCVAAAGNRECVPCVLYPAAYNFGSLGQVIAVSGTRLYNGVEKFIDGWNYSPCDDPISNPECAFIDVAAPGCDIPILSYGTSGYSTNGCGTSVSSPKVAALAGLILSIDSTLTPVQVYNIITKTADKIGQYPYNSYGWNRYLGYGRINAYNALNVARGAPNRPSNLTVTRSSNNHPLLRWNRNEESYPLIYRIYKMINRDIGFQLIAEISDTFYIDQTEIVVTEPQANERWVYYKISAAYYPFNNTTMLESVHTDPVSIKVVGPPLEKSAFSTVNYEYYLYQNYPNPFNPVTKIRYSLKEKVHVNLRIYDLIGREILTLVNEPQEAGVYEVEFNASNYNLNSGVYFYQINAGSFSSTKKLILLK